MRAFASAALLLAACAAVASAVDILTCDNARSKHARSDDFLLSACGATAKICRLRRKSDVKLELKFTPGVDVEKLTNRVFARLVGVPFPFLGVDGTSACESIFNVDGSKAECPLKKGQPYVYKNSFNVLEIYPKVRVDVHWALTTETGKNILCFEVPARIVG